MSVTYRKLDAKNDKDFNLFLAMENSLDDYLKTNKSEIDLAKKHLWTRVHMGAVEFLEELVPGRDTTEYRKQLQTMPDQVCYIAEENGETIGYVVYLNYWCENGARLGAEYGNINAILVKDGYKGTDVAFSLLKMALTDLANNGKNKITLTVQQDNPNRFLHFAMADTLLSQNETTRKDGSKTISYDLLISDINKVKNMSFLELGKRAVKIRRNIIKNNLNEPQFIVD